jgi:uncharacterized DUF497 family protein
MPGAFPHIEFVTICIYNKSVKFEWDPKKAAANKRRHGVSFQQAREVFLDLNGVEILDEPHSDQTEERYIRIGLSSAGLLFVAYTERGTDTVRIIHARRAEKKFVRLYEEEKRRY